MDTAPPAPSQSSTHTPTGPFRTLLADAIHFWELRRLFYNLALTAAAFAWVACSWPHFRHAFTLAALVPLTVLALLANACYSAAYLVDIPMQLSTLGGTWKRRRSILWLVGTLLALLLANYWIADEVYPDFH
jgi:hypothetical protein